MKCVHVNIRKATFILLTFLVNNVHHIKMADTNVIVVNLSIRKATMTNLTKADDKKSLDFDARDIVLLCPADEYCRNLNASCIECDYNPNCVYGDQISVNCRAKQIVKCKGERSFEKKLVCRYCYQTEAWEHSCELKAHCNSVASPRQTYTTNCTVSDDLLCFGHRTFNKNVFCNWTSGYRWSTTLALSIALGGFGADRFYLGRWQEGIGKLFSFGGLGVWTIIDVVLISLHYLGPADGSLYI